MISRLTKKEGAVVVAVLIALVLCSLWQSQRLRDVQLEEKKALYAERLRTAQTIIENEMLAAAYLTTTDQRTRELARASLAKSPQ
jgi:hypothetical protein